MALKVDSPAPSSPRPSASAPAPKPPHTTPRKPGQPRDPLKTLGLEDPRLALLCAPESFLDCSHPHTVITPAVLDLTGSVFKLRFTGSARAFNAQKRLMWSIPSATMPDAQSVKFPQLRGARRVEFEVLDAHGTSIAMSVFGLADIQRWLGVAPGTDLLVSGEIKQFGHRHYLSVERLPTPTGHCGIWARYAGIPGQISSERIEQAVRAAARLPNAIRHCVAHILGETGMTEQELLLAVTPENQTPHFPDLSHLLASLHEPGTVRLGEHAIEYARRISALAIQSAARRQHLRSPHPRAPLPIDLADVDQITATLPHALTGDQRSVIQTVARRLCEPTPLSALLSGDVGTGKTLAFLVPAIAAHRAGARVAIIAPRDILADQIALNLVGLQARLPGLRVERVAAGGHIHDPEAILVSTAGLAAVARKRGYLPQLLVLDEQHKFSAAARSAMVGPATHLLEVSATPVPRSLAMALYEGMEILHLRECPVQKRIHSNIVDKSMNGPTVIAAIRSALARGERAAMIYPVVVANAEDSRQSVESAFASLNAAFPGKVTLLHGGLSEEEIQHNIAQLRSGERPLVISSTVMEIGIDIPSVSVLVARDADRFGISQLHQLRGRLVRNGGEGHFLMVVESLADLPDSARERLEALVKHSDGYALAEMDLLQRGFGEMDGAQQSGSTRTLFRLLRLQAGDFLRRKLSTASMPAEARPQIVDDPYPARQRYGQSQLF